MEAEKTTKGDSVTDDSSETVNSDGCGFSALFQHKHRTNAENDAQVEPVTEKDGTTCNSSSEDDVASRESSATSQIPEYALFTCVFLCVCTQAHVV